jgi:hypothetical protein
MTAGRANTTSHRCVSTTAGLGVGGGRTDRLQGAEMVFRGGGGVFLNKNFFFLKKKKKKVGGGEII